MEAELKYRETSHYYSNKFMRNSKAVGVLWGIFTVCYAIITIVVFMQVGHVQTFYKCSSTCIQKFQLGHIFVLILIARHLMILFYLCVNLPWSNSICLFWLGAPAGGAQKPSFCVAFFCFPCVERIAGHPTKHLSSLLTRPSVSRRVQRWGQSYFPPQQSFTRFSLHTLLSCIPGVRVIFTHEVAHMYFLVYPYIYFLVCFPLKRFHMF